MTTSNKKSRKQRISPELKIARVILFILIAWAMMVYFSGCKPVERIMVKTEYIERIKYDSIYFQKYDSIFIEKIGDTVRIEKFKTVFKDRLKIQKDTIVHTDTIVFKSVPEKIEVIKEVPVRGFLWWAGLVVNIAGGIFMIYKIYTKLIH